MAGNSGPALTQDGYSADARLPWTVEEDQALLDLMKAGGPGSWEQKAAALDGGDSLRRRSANAVAHRWRKLRAKGLGEDCPPHYSQGMAQDEAKAKAKKEKVPVAAGAKTTPSASSGIDALFGDEGLFGLWKPPGNDEASDDDAPEGQTEEFQEKVIEELFLNEHVATNVAELLAEQEAWGAQVSKLQVFDSVIDMVHAALMVRPERTATLLQITRFCACCRWLKEVRGAPRINSYASFQSETTFKTMLVQRALSLTDQFDRIADGLGVRYRQIASMSDYVPKTSHISLAKGLLRTTLWNELTQRALNDRALRMAAAVMDGERPTTTAGDDEDPSRPTAQDSLVGELLERAQKVLDLVMAHRDADPFSETVDKTKFPEYYAVIKRPMDLGTVRKNLLAGKYSKLSMFAADMRLTFRNSLLVNAVGSEISKVAQTLLAMFERLFGMFVLDTSLDTCNMLENYELCQVCQTDKEAETSGLLLCDGCDAAYHIHCLDPPLDEIPKEDWYCDFCIDRRTPSHSEPCKFCHMAGMPLLACRVDLDHSGRPWNEKTKQEKERELERQKEVEKVRVAAEIAAKKKKKKNKTKGANSSEVSKKPTGPVIVPQLGVNYVTAEESGVPCVKCLGCGKRYSSEVGLKGHFTKGCDAGRWSCEWCNCKYPESSGRSPGPSGAGTLCAACSSRYRAGHTGPPKRDIEGNYLCEACGAKFETIRGLGSHRRGCSGGSWRCEWCSKEETETAGKAPGPNGPKTLCSTCGSRFRTGHTKMVVQVDGRFMCENCHKLFDTMVALGGHRRYCDGGKWRCNWCDCSYEIAKGKAPGPDGPKTLCAACGSRFRAGHSGPPKKDDDGMYVCPTCHKRFATIPALGGHRRYCDPTGKHDSLHNDDLELFSETLIADQLKMQKRAALALRPVAETNGANWSPTSLSPTPEATAATGIDGQLTAASPDTDKKDKKEAREQAEDLTVTTDTMMMPPPPTDFQSDPSDAFDVVSFVDWLHRFSEDLELPTLTVKQLFTLLQGQQLVEGVRPDILSVMHVKLVRILIEEMDEPTEMFYHVDMRIAKHALDEITWPEIMRLRVSTLDKTPINDPIRAAADAIVINGYDPCTVKEKLCVLSYLLTEVLSTSSFKDSIDEAQDEVEKIDQERMRFGMDKKRRANEKEVDKWVGKRVVLSCGNLGMVESGSRGVFRVKLDNPEGMVGIKIGKPLDQQVDGSKRDKGGICIRRPSEMRFADATDGDSAATEAADTSVGAGDFGDDIGQEQDLQLTPEEEAEQAEQDARLEQLSIRTEPLGQDRFYNVYWWFPSHPFKIYIENYTCYGQYIPFNVKAFLDAKPDPDADPVEDESADEGEDGDAKVMSVTARRGAANQAVRKNLESLDLQNLQNYVNAAKIPPQQLKHMQTKQQIVDAIMDGPLAYKMQPLAVRLADEQEIERQLRQLSKEAVLEILEAFDIPHAEDAELPELLALIEEKKLSRRINFSKNSWHRADLPDNMEYAACEPRAKVGWSPSNEVQTAVAVAETTEAAAAAATAAANEAGSTATDAAITTTSDNNTNTNSGDSAAGEADDSATDAAAGGDDDDGDGVNVDLAAVALDAPAPATRSSAKTSTELATTAAKTVAQSIRRPEHHWTYYDRPEQIDALLLYLNPSGPRERQLKEKLEVLQPKIAAAMLKAASVAAAEKAVLEVQAAGDDNDDEWNPGDENSSVSRNKRRRRGGGSPSTKERPPTTPPTERALDRVKDLMVKIQESHVAIISESNKTNLVSWFKNILSASTWTLVLPLVIELAELVDGAARELQSFAKEVGLEDRWQQWLSIWKNNINTAAATAESQGVEISGATLTFALYAFKEGAKQLPMASEKRSRKASEKGGGRGKRSKSTAELFAINQGPCLACSGGRHKKHTCGKSRGDSKKRSLEPNGADDTNESGSGGSSGRSGSGGRDPKARKTKASDAESDARKRKPGRPKKSGAGSPAVSAPHPRLRTTHGGAVTGAKMAQEPASRCEAVLRVLMSKDGVEIFSEPVDPDLALGYSDIVKEPADFGTIQKNLKSGGFATKQDFIDEVRQVFHNCRLVRLFLSFLAAANIPAAHHKPLLLREPMIWMQYNAPDAPICDFAARLEAITERLIGAWLTATKLPAIDALDDDRCQVCAANSEQDDDLMLLCEECDAAYHTFCLDPPLESVPEDEWWCPKCSKKRAR